MRWIEYLRENPKPLYWACVILLFPAVFYNLGLMPLIADEGIRAEVALEMLLSGDYITPRLGGVYYLNKPPLYNWFLAFTFQVTGQYDEFTIRLVMALFMLLFMGVMYLLLKKELGIKLAALTALSFFTCARVLTYDSLVGLIDICFSFFVFLQFYYIYYFGKSDQWGRMFGVAYALTIITFMLKGMPAIAFVGISLIAYLIYRRKFLLLFSWQHILFGLFCVGVIASYYWAYLLQNPAKDLAEIFGTLLGESSQRTAIENSIGDTVKSLVMFPLEYIYSFLPFTLLLVPALRKKSLALIKQQPFLVVMALLFAANIVLYWLSPKNHPRYLFMFVPLTSMLLFYLYEEFKKEYDRRINLIEHLFWILMILITLGTLAIPFLPQTRNMAYAWPGSIALFLALGALVWLFLKLNHQRMLLLILFLIIVRIGFNAFVLPVRYSEWAVSERVKKATELGEMAREKNLIIYAEAPEHYLHGDQMLNARTLFYVTAARGKAMSHSKEVKPGDWVIVKEDERFPLPADTVFILPSHRWFFPVLEVK